jgi:phosphoribosylamine---glycine ligase
VPRLRVAREEREVREAVESFGGLPVVVKPSGLTGGKGVKVMGPHLHSHADALDYGLSLLAHGGAHECVLIEEKVVGAEFTIQAISDGATVVFPPSTYDYPFRFDGDEGPGTGGMGSLSMPGASLPFMDAGHYEQACSIVQRVIERLAQQGRHFTGVMNSGFFATADGVKVIEFNARFGDPECMNIMSLLSGSWPHAMESICAGTLAAADVPLREEASVVLYLVSPDYALRNGPTREFTIDVAATEAVGARVFFSSAVAIGPGSFRTVGTSRALALAATAPTLERARAVVAGCAASVPELEWRRDVGDEGYLLALRALVDGRAAPGGEPLLPNAV